MDKCDVTEMKLRMPQDYYEEDEYDDDDVDDDDDGEDDEGEDGDEVDMTVDESMAHHREGSTSSGSGQWFMMGRKFPRSEVKYFAQVVILYIVILTCLANLSIGNSELNSLWITLLSSSIGYLLPSPYIPKQNKRE